MSIRCVGSLHFCWALFVDDATGLHHVEMLCNNSAAYFTIATTLLPDEVAGIVRKDGSGRLTAHGRDWLRTLSDRAQWSPKSFAETRKQAWRALGREEPAVPGLPPPIDPDEG